MSINSMANAAIGRRPDYEPLRGVPKSLKEISKAASGASAPADQVTSALNVIVAYIPTEISTCRCFGCIRECQGPDYRCAPHYRNGDCFLEILPCDSSYSLDSIRRQTQDRQQISPPYSD